MRPSKICNYMNLAEVVAARSHDLETKVGAILVNNDTGAILATGFNGFVRGAPDNELPSTRPEKYEYIIHAELNLITNCARHGIAMNNTMLVCTLSPCKICTRMLVNAGITTVITKTLYKDFDETLNMRDIDVRFIQTMEGLYEITYKQMENTSEK